MCVDIDVFWCVVLLFVSFGFASGPGIEVFVYVHHWVCCVAACVCFWCLFIMLLFLVLAGRCMYMHSFVYCFWFLVLLWTRDSCWYTYVYVYICTYECVSIHIYIYVLCFVFCVLGCLLVDLNVMCVYKILLFLWFWLCFCICMSIYMCSSVLIWGWDRVVLGMCLFRAGADILVWAVGGQNH